MSWRSLRTKHMSYLTAWQTSIYWWALLTSIILLVELGLLIWVSVSFSRDDGHSVLYEGSCDHVSKLDTASHLLMNLVSIVLLSASNYTMQCLSSPNRQEIDRAHASRQSLDIGVPSLKNLRRVTRQARLSWILLAVTSIAFAVL